MTEPSVVIRQVRTDKGLIAYETNLAGHNGGIFSRNLKVERDPAKGPGWYVFAQEVGGIRWKIICRPNVPYRRHKHYNCLIKRGFLRRYEALAVLTDIEGKLK